MVLLTRRATFSASHFYWNESWPEEKNRQVFGLCAGMLVILIAVGKIWMEPKKA